MVTIRRIRRFLLISWVFVLVGLFNVNSCNAANVLFVGEEQLYKSFEDAYTFASDGDTIYVYPGEYEISYSGNIEGYFIISKNNISIIGLNHDGTKYASNDEIKSIIRPKKEEAGNEAKNFILISGNGVNLEGLIIDNTLPKASPIKTTGRDTARNNIIIKSSEENVKYRLEEIDKEDNDKTKEEDKPYINKEKSLKDRLYYDITSDENMLILDTNEMNLAEGQQKYSIKAKTEKVNKVGFVIDYNDLRQFAKKESTSRDFLFSIESDFAIFEVPCDIESYFRNLENQLLREGQEEDYMTGYDIHASGFEIPKGYADESTEERKNKYLEENEAIFAKNFYILSHVQQVDKESSRADEFYEANTDREILRIVDFYTQLNNSSGYLLKKPIKKYILVEDNGKKEDYYVYTVQTKISGNTYTLTEFQLVEKNGKKYVLIDSNDCEQYIVAKLGAKPAKVSDTFKDVPENHWANEYIELAVKYGILKGKGDGLYNPNDSITRAEFVQVITSILNQVDGGMLKSGESTYTDVSKDSWYYGAINKAKATGLLEGFEEDRFSPNQPISREEMAHIIGNALNMFEISKDKIALEEVFVDHGEINKLYKENIGIVYKNGIMMGVSDNKFSPKENTTRAQTAVVAINILNLLKK